jgi:hypothetical protein
VVPANYSMYDDAFLISHLAQKHDQTDISKYRELSAQYNVVVSNKPYH